MPGTWAASRLDGREPDLEGEKAELLDWASREGRGGSACEGPGAGGAAAEGVGARGARSAPAHTLSPSDCYARAGPDCVRGSLRGGVGGLRTREKEDAREAGGARCLDARRTGIWSPRSGACGPGGGAVCASEAPERDTGFFSVGARDMIRSALGEKDVALAWAGRGGREQGDEGSEVSRSAPACFRVFLSSAHSPGFHRLS